MARQPTISTRRQPNVGPLSEPTVKRPYWFQRIAQAGKTEGIGMDTASASKASRQWFREKAQNVRGVDVNRLVKDAPKSRVFHKPGPEDIGSMLHFFYDPKLKDKLPYWDQFPLIFPIEFRKDRFLSINLHYLPPSMRARLMDALYSCAVRSKNDKILRLKLSYEILSGAKKFAAFRPCIKTHLFSQVRSRFFFVEPEEWDMALMLPTARFIGATATEVWEDSRRAVARARRG